MIMNAIGIMGIVLLALMLAIGILLGYKLLLFKIVIDAGKYLVDTIGKIFDGFSSKKKGIKED